MENLKTPFVSNQIKRLVYLAIFFASVALLFSLLAFFRKDNVAVKNDNTSEDSLITLKEVISDGTLTIGYGGFPPYTIIDLEEKDHSKRVKGYSIDLINEIANLADPPLKVEWVQFNWETIKADMASGRIELIADPVYQTIPRALGLGFSIPYAYFGIGAGIVKKGDKRFKKFSDLNRSDITISLAEGWTTSEFAKQNLLKPNFKTVAVTGDAFNQLEEVLLGRADVALNDVPTVFQYAEAHSTKVDAIFLDNPPSTVPGGFVTYQNSEELLDFLNTSIEIMIANGTLERIDNKWKTYHYIPTISLKPASGFK